MMSHLSEESLNLYLDHELSASNRVEVESHLAGCAVCQAALKELETVFDSLAEWQSVPLPFDISQRVMPQLELQHKKSRGVQPLVWAGLGLQLLTSLVLGILVYPWLAGLALPGVAGFDLASLAQTLQNLGKNLGTLPDLLSAAINFLPGLSFGNIGLAGWLALILVPVLGWLVLNGLLLKGSSKETRPTPASQRR